MENIVIEEDGQMELVPAADVPANISNKDAMMLKVIESGNVDGLERFIALREREEARQSQLEFEKRFAAMQKEFPPIKKMKKGHTSKYAPLEVILRVVGPIIAEHGFSYRWDEVATEGGKNVTMYVSGYGHTKENTFYVPHMPGNNAMNPVQVAAAMSSYGKRYSFVSGFGLNIEDEDTDGYIPPTGDVVEQWAEKQRKLIDALDTDGGNRAELYRLVDIAEESRNRSDAEVAMKAIKGAS